MDRVVLLGKWKKKPLVGTLLLLVCMFAPTLSLPSPSPAEEVQCPHGDYRTENGICCNKCSPGFKLKQECLREGERSRCEQCRKEEFTDQMNYISNCRRCKRCKVNEEEVWPCESYKNRECRCKDGFFKRVIDSETYECLKCTPCGPGERQTQKCTPEHDRMCECERSFYRNSNNKKECLPCKNCTAGCEHHCPPALNVNSRQPPKIQIEVLIMVGIGACVLMVVVGFISYKATKHYIKRRLTGSTPLPETAVSPDPDNSTEILIHGEEQSFNECNKAIPQDLVSEQVPTNLPDCIPLEIKIPELIYKVLDLVPVPRVRQLARSLGVTDIEIERAETDHRSCKEAHYQMLRVWAERGSQAGGRVGCGGVLHGPLLRELLDQLDEMHLGGAAQELETKYSIH